MAKWTSRRTIREYYGDAYSKDIGDYLADLTVLGYEALEYAYHNKGFKNRSYNLQDSYASGVYINGKLEETSVRFYRPQMAEKYGEGDTKYRGKDIGGREAAWNYLKNPTINITGDITLLCIAAMPYAEHLEDGTHRGGYHIQVISSAYDYIEREWHRVTKGKQFKVIRHRVVVGDEHSV